MQLLQSVLSTDSFFMVNKKLAKELSINASLVLAELISKQSYFFAKGMLNKSKEFYVSYPELAKSCCIGKNTAVRAVTLLKDSGLLQTKAKGVPKTNYYILNEKKILGVLDGSISLPKMGSLVDPNRVFQSTQNGSTLNKNKRTKKDSNKKSPTCALLEQFKSLWPDGDGYSNGSDVKFCSLEKDIQELAIWYKEYKTEESPTFNMYSALILKAVTDSTDQGELQRMRRIHSRERKAS